MEYDKTILEETGIFVFRNAISSRLCQETIETFYKNPTKQHRGKTGGGYKPNIKNTTDWYVTEEYLASKYFKILNLCVDKVTTYHRQLAEMPLRWTGLQFQKNEVNKGYFRWHSDYAFNDPERRILAPIFYLNDVAEGGETEFKHKGKIKPEEGTLVIFPATWEYYHRGVKPLSNNKYIITCFGIL